MLLRRPYVATIYFLTFQEFVQYMKWLGLIIGIVPKSR